MSSFTHSTISVHANAVKSILFHAAALALQFAVYKLFSWVASVQHLYTAFLMFAEDPIQKALFVFRTFNTRQGIVVLAFGLLFGVGTLYDTVLWALDKPGYVQQSSLVPASAVTTSLIDEPDYLIFVQGLPGSQPNLDDAFAANLFNPGVNISLTDKVDRKVAQMAKANLPFEEAEARIWLDDAGFAVGLDQSMMIAGNYYCLEHVVPGSQSQLQWGCAFDDTHALSFASSIRGRPEIWWETGLESQYLSASRKDNPWASLGGGGDTALMKQLFTVTKGNRRHTFLHSVVKAVMISIDDTPFTDEDVSDLALRFFGRGHPNSNISKAIQFAQSDSHSFTTGGYEVSDTTITANTIEFLRVLNSVDNSTVYLMLRLMNAEIALIRSDTLPAPVSPAEACDKYFNNEATAGKLRGTNCNKASHNATSPHFLGEIDISTVFILSGVLGDGSSSDSTVALNQKGVDWLNAARKHLDNLILSRGFILSVDPYSVMVELKTTVASVSYLQILLILIPIVLMLGCWALVLAYTPGHYQSSLLSTLTATTHSYPALSHSGGTPLVCKNPRYLLQPPDIQLKDEGEHVVLGTPRGIFRHDIPVSTPTKYVDSPVEKQAGVSPWHGAAGINSNPGLAQDSA
ncbi:MAG: hypothetical protein M1813_003511 [Trichoglossum hirsutum]|nr:MAG: hypothetical protein M1813_003511 [Trichoglossum hirsutum]